MIQNTRLYSGSLIGMVENKRFVLKDNPHVEVKLDAPVDAERLKKALEEAVKDCPYITYNVVHDKGLFFKLEENNLPLVLLDHKPEMINTPENNSHSAVVYYIENRIGAALTHALTDGCGLFWFMRTLLDHYFGHEGTYHFSDEPYYDRELMEEELPVPEDCRAPEISGENCVSFEINTDSAEHDSFSLEIPYADFKGLCGKWNASAQTVLTILSVKALAGTDFEKKDHVVVRMPINARNMFGAPHTFHNASIANMRILLDTEELTGEEAGLAEKIAAGIREQNSPGLAAIQFNEWRKVLFAKDRAEMMSLLGPLMGNDTMIVSYLGKDLAGNPYAEHVKGVCAGAALFALMVYGIVIGDHFYLSCFDATGGRKYKEALKEVLRSNGIKTEEV